MNSPFPTNEKVFELLRDMSDAESGTVIKLYFEFTKEYGKMSDVQKQFTQECFECLFEHFEEANQEED